jgi:hypothetical protein
MGQPIVAVAIARATPLLSARTGAFAEAGAAAATTTKLMDRHIAGTPRCHGFRRPCDQRGEAMRISDPPYHWQAGRTLDHPPDTGEVE